MKKNPRDWSHYALCGPETEHLFFPEVNQKVIEWNDVENDYTEARKLCAACPSQIECRMFAIETRIPIGMWGGLSSRERWQIHQREEGLKTERKVLHTRTCLSCNKIRRARYFPDDEMPVCQTCMKLDIDDAPSQKVGRPRLAPPDDVMIEAFTKSGKTQQELADEWGVSRATVKRYQAILMRGVSYATE